jgi:NAD(P)-dependent dehydrogenase (short-subunit alcohol dehydrogenase family)
MTGSQSALVLGARNLGGSIAADLVEHGYRVAAVARSADSLERARSLGALPIGADATDAGQLAHAVAEAAEAHGPASLFVNAVSASRPSGDGPWGGGPVAEAGVDGIRQWCTPVAEQCALFLQAAAKALRAAGAGGTIVQVTGGSARRAMPGRGAWAAGAAATRALVHAAAQELREEDIHVALLIVDATIASPKTADRTVGTPDRNLIRESDVAAAVRYLAAQEVRGLTHELVVTPAGDRWLP